ncbi:MAG: GNAT family N-acetyltransferase [Sporolactobacillus sp.]
MAEGIDFSLMTLNLITQEDYVLCKNFKSTNPSMDNFLKNDAYFSTITKEAATSLVLYKEQLVGYFTLQRHKTRTFEEINQNNFLYIERIAVEQNYQRKGIGDYILNNILKISRMVNERIIFLDALIEKVEWYEKRHFNRVIENESKLSNKDGLVLMFADLSDKELEKQYLGLSDDDELDDYQS